MSSESQGPSYGSEQEFYRAQEAMSANEALAPQQQKIDPMGMLKLIFVIIGAILTVVGVLVAFLLGVTLSGGLGFFFGTLAGVWGTGLVFLLLGLVLPLFIRNVESANIINYYLAAMANQDYITAFQYLDPAIRTNQNELDTQTWFTRRAQAYDERGRITNYVLRGFHLNPQGANYTIRLTRASRSYIVHFFLSKRGDTWKITGFDLF